MGDFMRTKVLVLGSTGLLGNAVASHFMSNEDYETVTTYRDKKYALAGTSFFFDALHPGFDELPADIDYVINCIGIIKPFMAQSIENAIYVNALFPWKLAGWCERHKIKLIHISTDCVYSGNKGEYTESDPHDALDSYGKSKSLGECVGHGMVLRTSIIGEEIHKNASLVAWVKSQKGKQIEGYDTHLWNGITTKKYAQVCDTVIQNGWYAPELFHIHASDDVSKYEMMKMFDKKYGLGLTIDRALPTPCNRTLRSEKPLCANLKIPSVQEMIEAM